jgi:hypothetical protein
MATDEATPQTNKAFKSWSRALARTLPAHLGMMRRSGRRARALTQPRKRK